MLPKSTFAIEYDEPPTGSANLNRSSCRSLSNPTPNRFKPPSRCGKMKPKVDESAGRRRPDHRCSWALGPRLSLLYNRQLHRRSASLTQERLITWSGGTLWLSLDHLLRKRFVSHSLFLLLDEPQPCKTNGEGHHHDQDGVLYHRSFPKLWLVAARGSECPRTPSTRNFGTSTLEQISTSRSFRSRICARPGGSGGRWFLPRTRR